MSIDQARLIELPINHDHRGNLTYVQSKGVIPFQLERVYWLYDVPGGESRAGHALKTTHQFLVAASGSFTVHLDDGKQQKAVFLNRSYMGLYIPPFIWRVINDFSSGAVCLSIVSTLYDPNDYYRDYAEFRAAIT
jgi:hypothetical protein